MTLPLVLFYHRLNCYSFNALAGAIDHDPSLSALHVDIALTSEQLRTMAASNVSQHERTIVALSMLTCQSVAMRRIIAELRSDLGTRVVIVAGGPHVTACPEEALAMGVDVAFCGEAETTFPALLRTLERGESYNRVQRTSGRVDLDSFVSFSPRRGMFGPIEITRGCAFACNYCQTSRIFGVELRHRSIARIVRQAQALRSVDRRVVRLLSPNAFSYGSSDGRELNLGAVRELLTALRSSLPADAKIIFGHFPSEARPEHVTAETLELLKEFADNDEVVIGAQSGSPRMLQACNRSHDLETVFQAVSVARKYGYKIIVDFIFGLPDETEADQRESIKAMEEVVRLGARIHPHIFAPLPQTPFAGAAPGAISPIVRDALDRLRQRRGIYENKAKDSGIRIQKSE